MFLEKSKVKHFNKYSIMLLTQNRKYNKAILATYSWDKTTKIAKKGIILPQAECCRKCGLCSVCLRGERKRLFLIRSLPQDRFPCVSNRWRTRVDLKSSRPIAESSPHLLSLRMKIHSRCYKHIKSTGKPFPLDTLVRKDTLSFSCQEHMDLSLL